MQHRADTCARWIAIAALFDRPNLPHVPDLPHLPDLPDPPHLPFFPSDHNVRDRSGAFLGYEKLQLAHALRSEAGEQPLLRDRVADQIAVAVQMKTKRLGTNLVDRDDRRNVAVIGGAHEDGGGAVPRRLGDVQLQIGHRQLGEAESRVIGGADFGKEKRQLGALKRRAVEQLLDERRGGALTAVRRLREHGADADNPDRSGIEHGVEPILLRARENCWPLDEGRPAQMRTAPRRRKLSRPPTCVSRRRKAVAPDVVAGGKYLVQELIVSSCQSGHFLASYGNSLWHFLHRARALGLNWRSMTKFMMRRGMRNTSRWVVLAAVVTAGAVAGLAKTPAADDRTVTHVLNRIAFGPRPGDLERVKGLGIQRYIDEQLRPDRIPDAGTNARLAALQTIGMSSRDLAEKFERPAIEARKEKKSSGDAPTPDEKAMQQKANSVVVELSEQKLLRAIYSERQLQEVLTDFWFNHFNVDARKGADRFMLTEYEREAIRPHVLGKFRDLLGATAKSPAMLFYLDNWMSADPNGPHAEMRAPRVVRGPFGRRDRAWRSRRECPPQGKNAPEGLNENYGRELMELHTLGVDGGYTQQDVTEVARAFTGWTIEQSAARRRFQVRAAAARRRAKGRPRPHDQGGRRRAATASKCSTSSRSIRPRRASSPPSWSAGSSARRRLRRSSIVWRQRFR